MLQRFPNKIFSWFASIAMVLIGIYLFTEVVKYRRVARVTNDFIVFWMKNGDANKVIVHVRDQKGSPLPNIKVIVTDTSGSSSLNTDAGGDVTTRRSESELEGLAIESLPF
jgi:hypothetical protein